MLKTALRRRGGADQAHGQRHPGRLGCARPVALGLVTGFAVFAAGMAAGVMLNAVSAASASTAGTPTPCEPLPAASSSAPASTTATTPASSTGSPGAGASGTPTASTQLCVRVTASESRVQRGGTALYKIDVSAEHGAVTGVTVAAAASPSAVRALFTVCSKGDGTATCTVGSLAAGQSTELQAGISVPKTATSVDTAKLTATANSSPGLAQRPAASATVTVTAPPAGNNGGPSGKHKGTPGNTHRSPTGGPRGSSSPRGAVGGSANSLGSPLPVGGLPALHGGLPASGSSSMLSPGGSAANLFPKISPTSTPKPTAVPHAVAADSSLMPLSLGSPEFDAQLVGLALLALAVAIAVTRLSLRRTRSTGPPTDGDWTMG